MAGLCKEENRFAYYNTRILYLFDDVLADTANTATFVDQLFELGSRSKDPIVLVVDSHGGMISQMIMLIDTMRAIMDGGVEIHTQTLGLAASSACIIQACGTPGSRYVSPLSRIMMHQPQLSGEIHVDATQLEIEKKEIDTLKKMFTELIVDVTGKAGDKRAAAQIKRDIERDKWFSASEAVSYGLADYVGITPILKNICVPPPCQDTCEQLVEEAVSPLSKMKAVCTHV